MMQIYAPIATITIPRFIDRGSTSALSSQPRLQAPDYRGFFYAQKETQ